MAWVWFWIFPSSKVELVQMYWVLSSVLLDNISVLSSFARIAGCWVRSCWHISSLLKRTVHWESSTELSTEHNKRTTARAEFMRLLAKYDSNHKYGVSQCSLAAMIEHDQRFSFFLFAPFFAPRAPLAACLI